MWAMWANILKNFVHGPSASVALWPGPYPGALEQKAKCHGGQYLQSLQCSTLVGGRVDYVHMTRWLVGHGHVAMWP
jgi:hypothetical protein